MSISLDRIREIAKQVVEGPVPHDGLKQFMDESNISHRGHEYYSFVYRMAQEIDGEYCLILGTELGRDTLAAAAGCPSMDVVSIDLSGRVPSTFEKHLGVHRNIRLVTGTDTTEWLTNPFNRRKPVDMAIVDTSHDWPIPMIEWYLLRPMMRSGSIVLFDDAEHDGPKRLMAEIALPKTSFGPDDPIQLHGANGFCVVQIP